MFNQNVSKVPGQVPKNAKDNPGHLENLEKISVICLRETLERQNKLLADRVFIKRLPDRGERILKLKERLEDELRKRDEASDICQVMSGLTIDGKDLSDGLEWKTRNRTDLNKHADDSREEETPLQILATHSGAGFHQKKLIKEEKPEPLIKPSDLAEDEEDKPEEIPQYEPFVEALSGKIDATSPKERFIPFKSLNKEKEPSSAKVRDITAASPPVSKLPNVKQVSLQESLKLQAEQAQHLRVVQMKHAAERLREKGSAVVDALPPLETTAHYRESPPSDSEEEILDEDAKEEPGGVTFPVTNS